MKNIILCLLLIVSLGSAIELPEGFEYSIIKQTLNSDASDPMNKALKQLQSNDIAKAEINFINSLEIEENFYAYWGLALCNVYDNADQRAIENYKRAWEINDLNADLLADFSRFLNTQPDQCGLASRLASEIYFLNQSDRALYLLLDIAHKQRCGEFIIEMFHDMIDQFPNEVNLKIFLSLLYSEYGMQSEAVITARQALELTDSLFHYKLMSYILTNNGYFVEAARICQKMSGISSKSIDTWEAWAYLEYKQAHYENAANYYKKILKKQYNIQTLLTLARIYHLFLDNPKKARYYCNAVLNLDYQNSNAMYLMAEIYRNNEAIKKALKYSEKQLEYAGDHPHSWYYHGKLLFEAKRYKEAMICLEKAVTLAPDMRRYRIVLANVYEQAGFSEKAQKIFPDHNTEPLQDLWKEENMLRKAPPDPQHSVD